MNKVNNSKMQPSKNIFTTKKSQGGFYNFLATAPSKHGLYFGFILTLTSLVLATFYDRLNNPDITLAYFGAALTTTLFGISFRTFHTQFLFEKEINLLFGFFKSYRIYFFIQ